VRVLVTGAAGVVGGVMVPFLHSAASVVALDVRVPPDKSPAVEWVTGSVTDEALVAQVIAGCTHVVHLATGVTRDWQGLREVDIDGTRCVLTAAVSAGSVRRVIVASTNHVVGRVEKDWLTQGIPPVDRELLQGIRPDSDYGAAKAFGEALARYIAETTPVAVSALRLGMFRAVDDPSAHVNAPGFDDVPGGAGGRLARHQAAWLRHEDLRRILTEEFAATDRWRLRYAVSDNPGRIWPLDVATWNPTARRGER
jgi:nucleoside-diphosphate-sugar epimerase